MAPEFAIDFDAIHIPISRALFQLGLMFSFLGCIYAFAVWSDPEGRSPIVARKYALPYDYKRELGLEESE